MITLPVTAVTDLMADVSTLVTDFWPLLVIAVAIPLFFYVANRIKSLVTKR